MSPPVFISYARGSSKEQAEALHRELGTDSFLDTTEIEDGASIPKTIVDALLASKVIVIFAEPTYFERWYCLWELRTALTPFLEMGPRALSAQRDEALFPIVIALPVKDTERPPTQLPPFLSQKKWPRANETQKLADQVRQHLAEVAQTLGERITASGGSLEAIRASLLAEPSVPEPKNLALVKRLFPLEWRQSIGRSFVGRANELWELDFVLSTMRREVSGAALSGSLLGAGGFGKTRLALEYVHRLGPRNHPGGIFWVDADVSDERLEEQFHGILRTIRSDASDLSSFRKEGRSVAQELGQALRDISRDERVLFVVDNVPETPPGQEPKRITTWCPAPGMVSLLLTSRARLDLRDAGITSLPVHTLAPADAVALLTEEVSRQQLDEQAWLDIAHWVGELPLALELLNRVLRVQAITPEELIVRAREAGPVRELDRHRESLDGEISRRDLPGVTQALMISYERLSESTQMAARLLAWLAVDPVPMAVLRALEPDVSPQARATLISRSMITQVETSAYGSTVPMYGEMHRVIADFLQERPADKGRELQRVCLALLHSMDAASIHNPEHWSLMSACVPLAERVLQALAKRGEPATPEEILLAVRVGQILTLRSLSRHAQRVLESSLPRANASLGPRHLLTVGVEAGLARVLHDQGESRRAVELQKAVVEKSQQTFGDDAHDTLASLNNLAVFLKTQGRYEEAFDIYNANIRNAQQVFGDESREAITAMDNLVVALGTAGQVGRAFLLSQQVVEVSSRVLGAEDPDTLTVLSNLASLHQERNEFKDAAALHRKVSDARSRILGKVHRDTLLSMANWAHALYGLKDYEGARRVQEQILDTYQKEHGETHPHTLQVRVALASTLYRLGMRQRAQELATEGLEISRRKFGDANPTTQSILRQYAAILMEHKEWARARELLQHLLEIQHREFGKEHVSAVETQLEFARVLQGQGENTEARELFKQVIEIRLRALGKEDPRTLEAVEALNYALLLEGDQAAEIGLAGLLDRCTREFGETHQQTLKVRSSLAFSLFRQEKMPEARLQFEKLLEGRSKSLGEAHNDTLDAMEALAFAYLKEGNLALARTNLEPVVAARLLEVGDVSPRTLESMRNLMGLRFHLADFDGARELTGRLIELQSRVSGEEHPQTLAIMEELSNIHLKQRDFSSAREVLRKVVQGRQRVLGMESPDTLEAMKHLAWIEQRLGGLKEAQELQEKILATQLTIHGEENSETLNAMDSMASVLFDLELYPEAQLQLEKLLSIQRRILGERHPDTLDTMRHLVLTLRRQGLTEPAAQLERQIEGP